MLRKLVSFVLALRPGPPLLLGPAGAWPRRWLGHGAALAVLALLCTATFLPHLHQPLIAEDGFWIRGDVFGNSWRLTAHWALHRLWLPLVHEHLWAYRVPSYLLHVANASLIYAVFLLFFHAVPSRLRASPASLHTGALLAGAAFVLLDRGTIGYLSALSYQLTVLFSLLAVALWLLHLRGGGTLLWLAAAAAYGLALLSHSYALPLPVFLALLEVCCRRKNISFHGITSTIVRYGALFGVLWLFLHVYGGQISARQPLGAVTWEWLGELTAGFGRHLLLVLAGFRRGTVAPDAPPVLAEWLVLGACVLLLLRGSWTAWSRTRPLGPSVVVMLFVVAWSGMTYLQELSAQQRYAYWRFYFHAAGLALGGAFLLVWVLEAVRAALRRSRALVYGVALAAALPPIVQAGHQLYDHQLRDALRLEPLLRPASADGRVRCAERRRTTLQEVREAIARGGSLRCAHLVGLDLHGLKLSGADLRGANLTGADLRGTRLQGARLDGAVLLFARMIFARARGASLRGADLRGADLSRADLAAADLREAQLRWAQLINAELPRARMDGAQLRQSDLTNADLSGVDLTRAEIRDVVLNNVVLEGTRLPDPLPPGVQLRAKGSRGQGGGRVLVF